MRKVFKYSVPFDGAEHDIAFQGPVLAVGNQNGGLVFWAELDDIVEIPTKTLKVFGTGHAIDSNFFYVGTTWFDTAVYKPLVLHLYMKSALKIVYEGLGYTIKSVRHYQVMEAK